jgi:hypothetical protein
VVKGPVEQDKTEDLDALWKQLNSKPVVEATTVTSVSAPTCDTVKIKRTYEFAGQLVTCVLLLNVLIIKGGERSC